MNEEDVLYVSDSKNYVFYAIFVCVFNITDFLCMNNVEQ